MKALITRKIGMTSTINENGASVAVTLLSADNNVITQFKTQENDGYTAIQVGAGNAKLAKPQAGHVKQTKASPAIMREFRLNQVDDNVNEDLKVGAKLTPEVFSVGDMVTVTGISKGKGFAGTIKRHNFRRGRKTHGGRSYRRVGSIGSMYPQKIFKGKKMAGQLGHERVTVKNLKVAIIDQELSVIGVVGAVPGPRKGIVLIREAA